RRFEEQHPCGRTKQCLDRGAPQFANARVVESCLYAVAHERVATVAPRRPVDRVRNKHMVAGPDVGEDRDRAGGESRRKSPARMSALEFVQCRVESMM